MELNIISGHCWNDLEKTRNMFCVFKCVTLFTMHLCISVFVLFSRLWCIWSFICISSHVHCQVNLLVYRMFVPQKYRERKLGNRKQYIKGFTVNRFHYDIKFWKYKDLYAIAKPTIYKYTIKDWFQRGYILYIFCMSLSSEILMVRPFRRKGHFLIMKTHALPLLLSYLWAILKQKGIFAPSPSSPHLLPFPVKDYSLLLWNFQKLSVLVLLLKCN